MHVTAADGPPFVESGLKMVRKPDPVYMVRAGANGTVETAEGVMNFKLGDFLVYDPQSHRVWTVDPVYVELHYNQVLDD